MLQVGREMKKLQDISTLLCVVLLSVRYLEIYRPRIGRCTVYPITADFKKRFYSVKFLARVPCVSMHMMHAAKSDCCPLLPPVRACHNPKDSAAVVRTPCNYTRSPPQDYTSERSIVQPMQARLLMMSSPVCRL